MSVSEVYLWREMYSMSTYSSTILFSLLLIFDDSSSLVAQAVKNALQCWRPGFDPWVGRSPGEGHATHSSIVAGKPHGQRSLVGYSPWDCKEMDTTEQLRTHPYCGCGCIAQVLELDGLGASPGSTTYHPCHLGQVT